MRLALHFLLLALLLGGGYFVFDGRSTVSTPAEEPSAPVEKVEAPAPAEARSPTTLATPPPVATAKEPEPKSRDSRIDAIRDLMKAGRPEAALASLKEILEAEPRNEEALLQLGLIHSGDPKAQDLAAKELGKVLDVNPENDRAVGRLLEMDLDGATPNAYATLASAYERSPDSANIAAGLGSLMLDRGQRDQAIALLEKGARDPRFAESSFNSLTRAYSEAGDNQRAVQAYERMIQFQTEAMTRSRDANQDYRGWESRIISSQLGLAQYLADTGQGKRAEGMAKEILSRYPDQPGALALLKYLSTRPST